MKRSCNHMAILIITALMVGFIGLPPGNVYAVITANEICTIGTAEPPFLSTAVIPNLMLVIDNSASMLDLGYINDANYCYDSSYNNVKTYAGYFTPSKMYVYDLTNKMFRLNATHASVYDTAVFTDIYSLTDVIYIKVNGVLNVTAFKASGNFLNWAAASKLDIQKEILTGGKYESSQLVMESRGCIERRMVREIAVTDSGGNAKSVTLGVRPPQEEKFSAWAVTTAYAVGKIVSDGGSLYKCTTAGTSGAISTVNDNTLVSPPAPRWALYTKTRWTAGAAYVAGDIVVDPTQANTIDEGSMYIATQGGTASASGGVVVDNAGDASRPKWEPYNLTQIEIFETIAGGYNEAACQLAINELAFGDPSLGQLKGYIDACMADNALASGNTGDTSNFNAAFNHSIHNCWYSAKHSGTWPPGSGPVQAIKPACKAIYPTDGTTQPWDITTEVGGYVCYGVWDGDVNPSTKIGYVGRCWKPASGSPTCTKTHPTTGECQKWDYSGVVAGAWDAAGYASEDDCIEQALKDYCGVADIPQVVDPSDLIAGTVTGETGEFWNIPALLTDSGVVAQLGQPLLVMKGLIEQPAAPSGIIQDYKNDIRMGVMVFNAEGSKYECDPSRLNPVTGVLYKCTDYNKDGGKVVREINQSDAHTDNLVADINAIKATSWTPIAEAMYNTIGYYSQQSSIRLNLSDFQTTTDPVQYTCQKNNVLIITEGASTADVNDAVKTFVEGAIGQGGDTDTTDSSADCGVLNGSTYLDDLTYIAKNYFKNLPDCANKEAINTYIVVSGTLRNIGSGECSPQTLLENAALNGGTTIYDASDPADLEFQLRQAFTAIRAGASAGSAASVISSSRSGEGASYQAIFWPSTDVSGADPVTWTGEVHAMLVDSFGYLYEDSNHNRTLDSGDLNVVFYFNQTSKQTKACNGTVETQTIDGIEQQVCTGTSKDLDTVDYLWSANDWLTSITPNVTDPFPAAADSTKDILVNRTSVTTPVASEYISNTRKRFIFTWNDRDNDGIVKQTTGADNEVLSFDTTQDWFNLSVDGSRSKIPWDFGVTSTAGVNEIVRWVRGLDQSGKRSRQLTTTWRLGDVIHSTPVSVAAPAEGFHFLYRDNSYAEFVSEYKTRRHMIYFGANDGMLHAVNGGFYSEAQKKFCLDKACTDPGTAPVLGAELWAYVPYNLLPHLKCMTNPGYQHKYFVDQRPRIFDVRIWDDNDSVHKRGWGTILVGAMRYGGAKISAGALDLVDPVGADKPLDTREFTSSYFILDITDPESPPVLLAEMTQRSGSETEMGYTLAIPTLVVMKDGTTPSDYKWYLVLGSGPTNLDGTSSQQAKVAVMPLDWLGQGVSSALSFRIPNQTPQDSGAWTEGGVFAIKDSSDNPVNNSFISDLVSVDFDLNANYKADVVYFGVVSGTWGAWGGGMYRLVTRKVDGSATKPSEWATLLNSAPFTDTQKPIASNPLPLIDTGQPVTASASVGTDGKNFWVYFGTGRFLYPNDKSDSSSNAQQTYYGIKEPMTFAENAGGCKGSFSWQTVEKTGTYNNDDYTAIPPKTGEQGLVRVDQILVGEAPSASAAALTCIGGGNTCLDPNGDSSLDFVKFDGLLNYIVGTGCGNDKPSDKTGTDGWYKNFVPLANKERNVGSATLLGGLVTYTSYQPNDNICEAEGQGYLYGVYFQTGTSFYIPVFVSAFSTGLDAGDNVIDKVSLGKGLATTPNLHVGKQEGAKAFVQTSTGTIVEIPQPNLPVQNAKTGKAAWGELK